MEKWQEEFEKCRHHLAIADHMAYITFTLLKENRLIIKILNELSESVVHLIKALLYYEFSLKRVKLYKDAEMNLKTFKERIAVRYLTKQELENVLKILEIKKKHENSPIEFVKNDKFVILIGDKYEILTIDNIKEMLVSIKFLVLRIIRKNIKTT